MDFSGNLVSNDQYFLDFHGEESGKLHHILCVCRVFSRSLQGVCEQCLVHKDPLPARSAADGKERCRTSELCGNSNSEASQWQHHL